MAIILRQDKRDDQFDEAIRFFCVGDYKQECFDKIVQMGGTIVAADMTQGKFPLQDGETLFFVCKDTPNLFATLRTDDPCVSFMAHGDRFVENKDRLLENLLASVKKPAVLTVV